MNLPLIETVRGPATDYPPVVDGKNRRRVRVNFAARRLPSCASPLALDDVTRDDDLHRLGPCETATLCLTAFGIWQPGSKCDRIRTMQGDGAGAWAGMRLASTLTSTFPGPFLCAGGRESSLCTVGPAPRTHY